MNLFFQPLSASCIFLKTYNYFRIEIILYKDICVTLYKKQNSETCNDSLVEANEQYIKILKQVFVTTVFPSFAPDIIDRQNNVWSALEFNFNRSAQVKAKWQFFSSTAFNKRHTRPWKRHSVHWAILRLGKSSLKDNSSERRALIGLHLDLYLVWYTYSLLFKRLICALSNKTEYVLTPMLKKPRENLLTFFPSSIKFNNYNTKNC